jgi:hypothetical protein
MAKSDVDGGQPRRWRPDGEIGSPLRNPGSVSCPLCSRLPPAIPGVTQGVSKLRARATARLSPGGFLLSLSSPPMVSLSLFCGWLGARLLWPQEPAWLHSRRMRRLQQLNPRSWGGFVKIPWISRGSIHGRVHHREEVPDDTGSDVSGNRVHTGFLADGPARR